MKHFFSSWLLVGVLLVFVVLLGKGVWNVYRKEKAARDALARTAAEHGEMKEREEFLVRDIARLKTGEGAEEEIRERFGFGREGERMIVVINPLGEDTSTSTAGASGFWERLKELLYFGG